MNNFMNSRQLRPSSSLGFAIKWILSMNDSFYTDKLDGCQAGQCWLPCMNFKKKCCQLLQHKEMAIYMNISAVTLVHQGSIPDRNI
jgi:hypothetical protein